jgi:glycosyltransferase involved in cell wall biosynthesis
MVKTNLTSDCSHSEQNQLTVVIPTYLNGWKLFDAVKSVSAADQVIVVSDGGKIDPVILENILKLKNIEFIEIDQNMGVTHARNVGFSRAPSGWVLFLDADDELLPGAEDRIREVCNNCNATTGVWLFANELKDGQSIPLVQSSGEAEALLRNANRGERTLVVKRDRDNHVLPFIGRLRGHERAGLYRYCTLTERSPMWSDEKVRVYSMGTDGLSSKRLSRGRAKLIGSGHLIVFKIAIYRRNYKLGLVYFLKSLKYYFVWWVLNVAHLIGENRVRRCK